MKIPFLINKRDDIPILNKMEVICDNSEIDFHLIAYFITTSKCKIIIRRLDKPIGWISKFRIKIYSTTNNNHDILIINPNISNSQILTYSVKIELKPVNLNYSQIVPKIVVQTAETNDMPLLKYNSIMTIVELNPEYKYMFFDQQKRRAFIKDNFSPDILEAYDLLIPGSYRADLFRYCFLYVNGGCYFDCKRILRVPIREWLGQTESFKLTQDLGRHNRPSNGMLLFEKNNKNLYKIIQDIKDNVSKRIDSRTENVNDLTITGPSLMGKYYKAKDCTLTSIIKKGDWNVNYRNSYVVNKNGTIICHRFYSGYYDNYFNKTHYQKLFKDNKIYYLDKFLFGNYKVYIFPYDGRYKFDVKLENRKLFIKRIDRNKGWNFDLKIKIVNNKTNNEKTILIGQSTVNVKTKTVSL